MKIETNIKISKSVFFSSIILFLVFLYLFCFYPDNKIFEKLVDMSLIIISVSVVLVAYFGSQRDLRNI